MTTSLQQEPIPSEFIEVIDNWRFGRRSRVVAGPTEEPGKREPNVKTVSTQDLLAQPRLIASNDLKDEALLTRRIKPYVRHNRTVTKLGANGYAQPVKGLFGKIQTRDENFLEFTARTHIAKCWLVGPNAISDKELERRVRIAEAREAQDIAEHTARLRVTTEYPSSENRRPLLVVNNAGGEVIE